MTTCLQCGKPVGAHPIPHDTEGWTCSPTCDFAYGMRDVFRARASAPQASTMPRRFEHHGTEPIRSADSPAASPLGRG
jgi:hypothetical protein